MLIADYQALAMRTSQWQPDHPNYRKTEHRTYGEISLAGETGELVDAVKKRIFHGRRDDEKIVNECGDVAWSIACLCEVHGLDFAEVAESALPRVTDLPLATEAFCLVYAASDSINDSQAGNLNGLFAGLSVAIASIIAIARDMGATFEGVLIANVNKLRKRYPYGYSDAASIARADCEGAPTLKQRAVATIEGPAAEHRVSTKPEAMEGEG